MKSNNFFKSFSTPFLIGAFALSLAACGGSGERSTVEGAEEIIEEEQQDINDATVEYENGEYGVINDNVNYNIDQEYAFDDRGVMENRLRQDIDRIDSTMERMSVQREEAANDLPANTVQEWEVYERMLERHRERLNQTLMNLEQSNRENWETVRTDVNNVLREWERDWEKFENSDLNNEIRK